jgi:hypothetical protein
LTLACSSFPPPNQNFIPHMTPVAQLETRLRLPLDESCWLIAFSRDDCNCNCNCNYQSDYHNYNNYNPGY